MATVHEPHEILATIDPVYNEIHALIDDLSPEQRMLPGAAGRWRLKDVLSHMARWNDVAYEEVTAYARGEPTGNKYDNFLEYNDKWEAQDWERPLAEAEQHFEASHARLVAFLRGLEPDQWSRPIRRWAWIILPEHYGEHIDMLRSWRAEMAQTVAHNA